MTAQQKNTPKSNAAATKATTNSGYTARDLAKDAGVATPAIARRYLRAAKLSRPKPGWVWPDKAAAKAAIETVQKAAHAAKAEAAK